MNYDDDDDARCLEATPIIFKIILLPFFKSLRFQSRYLSLSTLTWYLSLEMRYLSLCRLKYQVYVEHLFTVAPTTGDFLNHFFSPNKMPSEVLCKYSSESYGRNIHFRFVNFFISNTWLLFMKFRFWKFSPNK